MADPSTPAGSPPESTRPPATAADPALFRPAALPGRTFPTAALAVAGILVIAVVAALLLLGGRHHTPGPTASLPPDPYAVSLPITGTVMSESISLSGGKSTFIDGHVRNTGTKTVTAATLQVFFRNDEGMPPGIETLPLSLIRTREPYVDTEPISADPIKPGEDREFRLIFETIPGNWNVQKPEIHIVHVTTR